MPVEVRPVPDPSSQSEFGSLQGCFVDGSAEQRARERRIKRRALSISIALQTAILTVVVLVPLLAKPERLAYANPIPIPPYAPARSPAHSPTPTRPIGKHTISTSDLYNAPKYIPSRVDETPDPPSDSPLPSPAGPANPCVGCIPIEDSPVQPQPPAEPKASGPKRLFRTSLEPAMLIYRVEPIYPPLARQIRRGGKVELRAIIATDGTIQSLQVVSGEPIFLQSAEDAVRQWRYRPTALNGQPVEIDTFITVVYNLQP